MAIVPKTKLSKARKNKRRSNVWKIFLPTIVNCSKCGEYKLTHRVCKKCGHYRNREIFKVEA